MGPIKVFHSLQDGQVLFLSDVFATGYQAAEFRQIMECDMIAMWGWGPVEQFAIRSGFMLGAGRVIAIDHHAKRVGACGASPGRTPKTTRIIIF